MKRNGDRQSSPRIIDDFFVESRATDSLLHQPGRKRYCRGSDIHRLSTWLSFCSLAVSRRNCIQPDDATSGLSVYLDSPAGSSIGTTTRNLHAVQLWVYPDLNHLHICICALNERLAQANMKEHASPIACLDRLPFWMGTLRARWSA